jgi:hypothetical protein
MAGALTCATALVSMGFSALLMAMGATLLLGGNGAGSVGRCASFGLVSCWPQTLVSLDGVSLPLPLKDSAFRNLALAVLCFVLVFNIGTYRYYRGSVVTPFHGGPASSIRHHLTLGDATLLPDGGVRFLVSTPAHRRRRSILSPRIS